jgi:hypothetical protein
MLLAASLLWTSIMSVVVAVYDEFPLVLTDGRVYTAQACGRERPDGTWEGWLEFVPNDGSLVLRSQRETTQSRRADLEYWAGGLTAVYLQGALERTLAPPPLVGRKPPDVPAVYDEPAATGAVTPNALADEPPVLDPFVRYMRDEGALALELASLTPAELRAIIAAYGLADSTDDLDAMTAPELAGWIVGAVRARRAA